MADPTPYVLSYSFGDYQESNPSLPLPALQVDAQFASLEISTASIVAAVQDVRRSDGALKNKIVTQESLATDLRLGLAPPEVWAASTDYLVNDTVFSGSKFYICHTEHTSGSVFSATNWTQLADLSGAIVSDSGKWFTAARSLKTSNYTILTGDAGAIMTANKATAIQLTFDNLANLGSGLFPVRNMGAGLLTLAAASGETINGAASVAVPTGTTVLCWPGSGTNMEIAFLPAYADIVTGPASAVNARFAAFSGTTGKLLADSGYSSASFVADPGANGIPARTAAGAATARTITAGAGASVTNGDGVSGNPTVAVDKASVANVRAGTADKVICADIALSALDWVALTDAASISVDHAAGVNRSVTIAGNRAFATPTNAKVGWPLNIRVKQDGSGSKVPTWASEYDFGDYGTPVLSTGANNEDLLTFLCVTTSKFAFLGLRKRID